MQEYSLIITIVIAILIIVITWVIQNWRAKYLAYRCSVCGDKHSLSLFKASMAPHMMGAKYVKCPKCGRWCWELPTEKE